MRYRTLGTTGISISEIGCGTWALGGLCWEDGRSSGWSGHIDEQEIKKALYHALDMGVNHFDTADVYGNGKSEQMLGRILLTRPENLVIASKIGYFKGTAAHAYEPHHIMRQCEQSLLNLKRDHLDIYYFHHANFGPADCYLDAALEAMHTLRDQGKIRAIGVSAYAARDFIRLVPRIKPDVLQSFAHCIDYHFIAPNSPVMNLCKQHGCSFIAMSPLSQGILTGKYLNSHNPTFPSGDHRERSEKFKNHNLTKINAGIKDMLNRFGPDPKDLIAASLGFILAHKHVAGVIPGFRNLTQLTTNVAAAQFSCNGEDLAFIRKAFLDNDQSAAIPESSK